MVDKPTNLVFSDHSLRSSFRVTWSHIRCQKSPILLRD
jgi:hypothetical protein